MNISIMSGIQAMNKTPVINHKKSRTETKRINIGKCRAMIQQGITHISTLTVKLKVSRTTLLAYLKELEDDGLIKLVMEKSGAVIKFTRG